MSLDRSLKSKSALVRSRNVLTRAERLAMLRDEERWNEQMSVFGLPKVRVRRVRAGSKSKSSSAQAVEEAAAAEGAEAATPDQAQETTRGEK